MAGWPRSIRSGLCVRRPQRRQRSPPFPTTSSAPTKRAQLAAGNPLSFLHVTRSEIDLPPDADPVFDARCTTGRARTSTALREQRAAGRRRGAVARISTGCGWAQHEQTGIAGCFSVDEYERDVIKKHERTRRDKEDDRTRHIDPAARADRRRVPDLSRRRGDRRLQQAVTTGPPLYDFTAPDGVHHTIWRAGADRPRALVDAFARNPGAVHCRRSSSRRERGAGAHRAARSGGGDGEAATRSSPWRSPTTRCRSCPTTARSRILPGATPAEFLARAARSG